MEPAGSLGLDVLQTVGTDAAVLSGGRGAGLRCVRRGTVAAVCVLPDAKTLICYESAAGAIT